MVQKNRPAMTPSGGKRGRERPGTPPPSHKRVRSAGALTTPNTGGASQTFSSPFHDASAGGLTFPTPGQGSALGATPGSAVGATPGSVAASAPTSASGPASRQRSNSWAVSHSARRVRAHSDAYRLGMNQRTQATYTPAFSAPQGTGPNGSSSSRHVPEEMKMGGVPLKNLGLGIPLGLPEAVASQRARDLEQELGFQAQYPPCLPPSDVPDLEPKSSDKVNLPVPEDATPDERKKIEAHNNDVAFINKGKDRRRNNKAAKKSRETRIESLARTREMLLDTQTELNWLRMSTIANGNRDSLARFEELRRAGAVQRIKDEVASRVEAVDNERLQEKKRRDSIARVRLNRSRGEVRKESLQRLSKERGQPSDGDGSQSAEELQDSEPHDAAVEAETGGSTSATPSRVLTYGQGQPSTPQNQGMADGLVAPDLTWSLPSLSSGPSSIGPPPRGSNAFMPPLTFPVVPPPSGMPSGNPPSDVERRRQVHAQRMEQRQAQVQNLAALHALPFHESGAALRRQQPQVEAPQPMPDHSVFVPVFLTIPEDTSAPSQTQQSAPAMDPNSNNNNNRNHNNMNGVNQQEPGQNF